MIDIPYYMEITLSGRTVFVYRYYQKHALYPTWRQLFARCYDKYHKSYPSYGGNGVEVCERWHIFEHFLEDMGGGKPSPEHQLDRINSDGNYAPDNCRWVTVSENNSNRRPYGKVPQYYGVTFGERADGKGKRYPYIRAYISLIGYSRSLTVTESVSSVEEAALAYDAAALEWFGLDKAKLNFPDKIDEIKKMRV